MSYAKAALPGKSMPTNAEAERALLGGIFMEPGVLPSVRAKLDEATFFNDANRKIYRAICALDDANRTVDLVSVADIMQREGDLERIGGNATLADIASYVPTAAGVGHYVEILAALAIRRSLIQAGAKLIEDAYEWPGEVNDLLALSQSRINGINSAGGFKSVTVAESAVLAVRLMERLTKNGGLLGCPTGLPEFDKASRGVAKGVLCVLAARPSNGKTTVAQHIAKAAARAGRKVRYFNLDMANDMLGLRNISSESGVDMDHIFSGQALLDSQRSLYAGIGKLQSLDFRLYDGVHDIADIEAECRLLKSKGDIDLAIIDHLHLVTDRTVKTSSPEVLYSGISGKLKRLAKGLDISILALAQLNRAAESRETKEPSLSDLRHSGAIEQDAFWVTMLHYPYRYFKQDTNPNELRLIIVKHQMGECGMIPIYFNAKTTSLYDPTRF